jgi:hypothetical protein
MQQLARNQQRSDHGFPTPLALVDAITYLEQEMQALNITSGILFLDIEQPMVERLRKKTGSRTGACLHIKYQGKGYVLACDRWQTPEHNIYALHLAFRQWASMERWGVGSVPLLLHGFESERVPETGLMMDESAMDNWMLALGLGPTATLEDAVAVYHRRAKQSAQDPEMLSRLNALMDEARAHFARQA